jgi:hypothetical protein
VLCAKSLRRSGKTSLRDQPTPFWSLPPRSGPRRDDSPASADTSPRAVWPARNGIVRGPRGNRPPQPHRSGPRSPVDGHSPRAHHAKHRPSIRASRIIGT